MDLGNVVVGSTITGTAQESGTPITAEITEISKYPSNADGNSYGGDSNPNASSYPFTAYIEDSDDLINHEYVDIQIEGNGGNGSSVYLPKALIRMENGQSYVYIEGKNKKLKKQYVRTGQTLYSTYIEVKEGVSETELDRLSIRKSSKRRCTGKRTGRKRIRRSVILIGHAFFSTCRAVENRR